MLCNGGGAQFVLSLTPHALGTGRTYLKIHESKGKWRGAAFVCCRISVHNRAAGDIKLGGRLHAECVLGAGDMDPET